MKGREGRRYQPGWRCQPGRNDGRHRCTSGPAGRTAVVQDLKCAQIARSSSTWERTGTGRKVDALDLRAGSTLPNVFTRRSADREGPASVLAGSKLTRRGAPTNLTQPKSLWSVRGHQTPLLPAVGGQNQPDAQLTAVRPGESPSASGGMGVAGSSASASPERPAALPPSRAQTRRRLSGVSAATARPRDHGPGRNGGRSVEIPAVPGEEGLG